MIDKDMSDTAVLKELGCRISRCRLNKNMTQDALAVEAGISRPTVQRVESGQSIQILKLIRILRMLNLLENIDALIPEPAISPIQQVKMHKKIRKRASSFHKQDNTEGWSWGDD